MPAVSPANGQDTEISVAPAMTATTAAQMNPAARPGLGQHLGGVGLHDLPAKVSAASPTGAWDLALRSPASVATSGSRLIAST